jgi:hypothetical protein
MDHQTFQKIATEIARHFPTTESWIIQAIIVMVAAGLGAFFGQHVRTRGKNLATKADFESLKDQLRFNTKIVETIKRDVDHKDWAKREWTNLRRVKLEALINAMHDCTAFLPRHRNSSVEGKYHDEQEPMDELDTLASLYLPELKLEVLSFTMACRELVQLQLSMGKDFLTVKDAPTRDEISKKHMLMLRPSYEKVGIASAALENAATKVLLQIMNVSPA